MAELSSYAPVTTLVGTERFPLVTTPGVAGGNKYITATNLATAVGGSMSAAAILAALLTVDGPGSGLNADLLDGLSSAAFELKPSGVLSLADYGAVGDGVADDSVPIRNWCAAAAAYGATVAMFAPPGTYKTTLAGRTTPGAWAGSSGVIGVIPSNTYVYGVPQKTWFYMTGVPASDTDNGGAIDLASYNVFGIDQGSSNIVFEHLAFRGENTSFTYYFNNQSGCIAVYPGTTAHDILVQNCRFRDLYGFNVHDPGEDEDVHVKDCWMFQCSNGLNVNANGTIQTGNYMDTCEGIECSGKNAVIDGNVILNAQNVGISMGGAGDFRYGNIITNNVIDGSTGSGILMGDGCFGSVIDGNFVRKSKFQGLSFGEAFPGWAPDHCVISNNTFVDNGLISAGAGSGMDLGFDNHIVTGNMCYNTGDDVLYAQQYACIVRGDNVFLDGNYFDGSVRDLDVPNTAANLRLGQNFYKNNTVYWESGGTSSLFPDNGWFKAATDKIRNHSVMGDSTGEPYSHFSEYADGKFEWGAGGGNARDTNLYRSGADTLKTDDRFKTGSSTTGSRPSAATAGAGALWFDTTLNRQIVSDGTNWWVCLASATATLNEYICVAISDETTAITTGTAKVTFRMPFALTVTAVRASLNTASSSGIPTFDINEAGTTILSTKLTIDASELTSATAATAAVISDTALADDAEITIDVDTAGTGAKGAKIWIIGTRVL